MKKNILWGLVIIFSILMGLAVILVAGWVWYFRYDYDVFNPYEQLTIAAPSTEDCFNFVIFEKAPGDSVRFAEKVSREVDVHQYFRTEHSFSCPLPLSGSYSPIVRIDDDLTYGLFVFPCGKPAEGRVLILNSIDFTKEVTVPGFEQLETNIEIRDALLKLEQDGQDDW